MTHQRGQLAEYSRGFRRPKVTSAHAPPDRLSDLRIEQMRRMARVGKNPLPSAERSRLAGQELDGCGRIKNHQ
jgi:hypothetical protein